jgi:peroxiredoxin
MLTGIVVAGTLGYGAKRFMDPHNPPGIALPAMPRPGSEWAGKKFDVFKLRGADGKTVDGTAHLGRRPVVVLFHGGRESPFSMMQVVQLGASKELAAAKAVVYVVSIDDPATTAWPVRREWRRRGYPPERTDFIFVGDDYGQFSRKYVGEPSRPNPSLPGSLTRGTFVIGKDREILYSYVNVTPKLHPPLDQVLAAVQRAGKEIP